MLVILVLLIRGAWGIHEKALLADHRLEQAKAELTGLQQQHDSLSASIGQLSTTQGIEAALREKYHAVKEGESVAVIVDTSTSVDDNATGSPSQQNDLATSSMSRLSWWGSVLQFIGF